MRTPADTVRRPGRWVDPGRVWKAVVWACLLKQWAWRDWRRALELHGDLEPLP